MKIIENGAQARAIADETLRRFVLREIRLARRRGLEALTCLAVVEGEDKEDDLRHYLGFSPLENPLTGLRFGDAGFEPGWDWIEQSDGWYRLVFTVGDDGFAYVLLVLGSCSGLGAAIRALASTG